MSDALKEFEDLGTPESAIMIAVVDGAVHVAYSLNLQNKYDDILDILETAATMVASAMPADKEKFH